MIIAPSYKILQQIKADQKTRLQIVLTTGNVLLPTDTSWITCFMQNKIMVVILQLLIT